MINIHILFLLLVVVSPSFTQTDYCRPNLCKKKKHIACNNKGELSDECHKHNIVDIIKITPAIQKLIVHKHNELRNKAATGFDKFPPAERMASMRWSNELADLAVYNVKQCEMKHDECRNTDHFKFVGQNIAEMNWTGMKMSVVEVITMQIEDWFNEYKDCPLKIIKKFFLPKDGHQIAHFTAMIQEKATHVGCSILRTIDNSSYTQLMTCNYAYNNLLGYPVYITGETASKCQTGINKDFKALCSLNEKYV